MVQTTALKRLGRCKLRCDRDHLFRKLRGWSANLKDSKANEVLASSCYVQHELHARLQKTKQDSRVEKHRLLEMALDLETKLQLSSEREHALVCAIVAEKNSAREQLAELLEDSRSYPSEFDFHCERHSCDSY